MNLDADGCAEVLRRAFPGVAVRSEAGRFGPRARADAADLRSLQYLYLAPSSEGRIELLLYPADTLTQARAFYASPRASQRLLELRALGWRVEPNFHFGYMERGLTWTETRMPVDAYLDHWLRRIDGLGVVARNSWPSMMDELVAARIVSNSDRRQFDIDFTQTKRTNAIPRPGVRVVYAWPGGRFSLPAFPEDVRDRANEVIAVLE